MNKIIMKLSKVILAMVLLFSGLMPAHATSNKAAPDIDISVEQYDGGFVQAVWQHNNMFSEEEYLEYFDYFLNVTGWKLENKYGTYEGDIVFEGEYPNASLGESDNEVILTLDESAFNMIPDTYSFTLISNGYEDKVINDEFEIIEQYGTLETDKYLYNIESTSTTTITLTADETYLSSIYCFEYGKNDEWVVYDLREDNLKDIRFDVAKDQAYIEIPALADLEGYCEFKFYSDGFYTYTYEMYLGDSSSDNEDTDNEDVDSEPDYVPVTMVQLDNEPYDIEITMTADSDYLMMLHTIDLVGKYFSNSIEVVIGENATYSFDNDTYTATLLVDSSSVQSLGIGEYDVYLYAEYYDEQHIENFRLTHGAIPTDDIEITVKQSNTKPYDLIISASDKDYLKDIAFVQLTRYEPEFEGFVFVPLEEMGIVINENNELVIPYQQLYGIKAETYEVAIESNTYAPTVVEGGVKITHAGCTHNTLDELKYLKEQELTCTNDGVKESYYCEKCDGYMLYKDNLNWIWLEKDVITKAEGHKFVDGKCDCGEVEKKDVSTNVEDLPVVDTTKPVEDVTVGTDSKATATLNETAKELLENIEANKEITNVDETFVVELETLINEGKDVELVTKVTVETVTGDQVNTADLKLIVEEVSKVSETAKVVQYLDLGVVMNAMVNDKVEASSNVSELSKPMTFTVALPEELKVVPEGYTRNYFVVRVHDGKTDKLPVTVNSDGTLSFETDKFSTYALAYEDVENAKQPVVNSGDASNIALYASLAMIALAATLVLRKKETA